MVNENIKKKYEELCKEPSDINELLPYILHFAKKCKHITEMGVRNPTSTYAFLAGDPDKLISYDIYRSPGIDEVEKLAPENYTFILKDVLTADIESTEFLFIDTYHTGYQLEKELALHAEKADRYIGFHDTYSFWEIGEMPYTGIKDDVYSVKGLKYAIVPFLKKGGWKIAFMTDKNNGLLIIERTGRSYPFNHQFFTHIRYLFFLRTKRFRRGLRRIFK